MRMIMLLLCCLALFNLCHLQAFAAQSEQVPDHVEALPGVELAQSVATATGIAITPLLGVSAVGAWKYYSTPVAERIGLPWYASPWFWAIGLTLVLLLLSKDLLLGFIPGVKKPFDALEVVENKVSAVVATPAIIPMFTSAMSVAVATIKRTPSSEYAVTLPGMALTGGTLSDLPVYLLWSFGLMIVLFSYFAIWLAFHAINVLILLSPFGPLDLLLRSVKLFVLIGLVGATWISPYLGLVVSLLILLVSLPIAGWSFRLMVFGWVLSWDLLTIRHRRFKVDSGQAAAFTATKLGSVPVRTYGQLQREGERLSFRYRPWLVLRSQTLGLTEGSYNLGRGVLCPLLIPAPEEAGATRPLLRFPPRYRSQEEPIAKEFGLTAVVDMPLRRGLRAAFSWLGEMIGRARVAGGRLADQATKYVVASTGSNDGETT